MCCHASSDLQTAMCVKNPEVTSWPKRAFPLFCGLTTNYNFTSSYLMKLKLQNVVLVQFHRIKGPIRAHYMMIFQVLKPEHKNHKRVQWLSGDTGVSVH